MRTLMLVTLLSLPLSAQQSRSTQVISKKTFKQLHALIKPQPDEWSWAKIDWSTSLWEARKKAAAEGKPMFIWTMIGQPTGQC